MKFSLPNLPLVTVIIALSLISPQAVIGQDQPAKNPDLKVELPEGLLEPDAALVEHLVTHSREKICEALLKRLMIKPDKSKDPSHGFNGFTCKLVSPYKLTRDPVRYVLVYDSNMRAWPGLQPQIIVIADAKFAPLSWQEVGGDPMLKDVSFAVYLDNPVVSITCVHQHTFGHPSLGIYRYSLRGDEIKSLGEPVWIYPVSGIGRGLKTLAPGLELPKE